MSTDKLIDFFSEKEKNEDFNKDFTVATSKYKNEDVTRKVKNILFDLKQQVPSWDYSTALISLSIAQAICDKEDIRKKANKNPKGLTRHFIDELNDISDEIEKDKKIIGVDAKSLANKGTGSISESISDVVRGFSFNQKKFVCKVVFMPRNKVGAGLKPAPTDIDEFKHMDDEKMDEYLQTAEA